MDKEMIVLIINLETIDKPNKLIEMKEISINYLGEDLKLVKRNIEIKLDSGESDSENTIFINSNKSNNLKTLDCIYGVYVFYTEKEIQYIGCCASQSLKTRVSQHLSRKDSGGTFRLNYYDENDTKDYNVFLNFVDSCKLVVYFCNQSSKYINAVEGTLLSLYPTVYNRKTI